MKSNTSVSAFRAIVFFTLVFSLAAITKNNSADITRSTTTMIGKKEEAPITVEMETIYVFGKRDDAQDGIASNLSEQP